VNNGKLTLDRVVSLVATRPAEAFGLMGTKGAIQIGADADLVVADMDSPWTITNDGVLSRCGWTPYDGREISTSIDRTFVRGEEVFADGRVLGKPGYGRLATTVA
jgi:dihydroorotase-like cyclic amidohydrolase